EGLSLFTADGNAPTIAFACALCLDTPDGFDLALYLGLCGGRLGGRLRHGLQARRRDGIKGETDRRLSDRPRSGRFLGQFDRNSSRRGRSANPASPQLVIATDIAP